jgi:hypothetical protein
VEDESYLYLQAMASQTMMADWAKRVRRTGPVPQGTHPLPLTTSPPHHFYPTWSATRDRRASTGGAGSPAGSRQLSSAEDVENSEAAVGLMTPHVLPPYHLTKRPYGASAAHHEGGRVGGLGVPYHFGESPQASRRRSGSPYSRYTNTEPPLDEQPKAELVRMLERMAAHPGRTADWETYRASSRPGDSPRESLSPQDTSRQYPRRGVSWEADENDTNAGCLTSRGRRDAPRVGAKRGLESPTKSPDMLPPTQRLRSVDEPGLYDPIDRRLDEQPLKGATTTDSSTQVVDERVQDMAMLVLTSNHPLHIQELMLRRLSTTDCVMLLRKSHSLPSESCDMLTRCILRQPPVHMGRYPAREAGSPEAS